MTIHLCMAYKGCTAQVPKHLCLPPATVHTKVLRPGLHVTMMALLPAYVIAGHMVQKTCIWNRLPVTCGVYRSTKRRSMEQITGVCLRCGWGIMINVKCET